MPDDFPTVEQTRLIFKDEAGSPLNILVDPGAVTNRPKLVRILRKLGAQISNSVAEAQLILVDPHTPPGRQFIHDWGQDANKVVLDYRWAHKSINADRALLLADGWGDCIALDDGGSINDEDEQLNAEPASQNRKAKSALPTPRLTPPRRTSVQTSDENFADPSGSRVITADPETSQQALSQPSLGPSNTMMQPPAYSQSVPLQAPNLPYHQPSSERAGQSMMKPQTVHNPTMVQASQPYVNSVHPSPQMTQDVMNYRSRLEQPYATGHLAQQPPKGKSAPDPFYSVPFTSKPDTTSLSQSVAPRAHRKPMPSTSLKGKTKDGTSTPHARRQRSPSSPEPDLSSLFASSGTPSTEADVSTPFGPALRESPHSPRMVFTKSSGASLSFFVQVDLTNRSSVVTKIKRNNGLMVSDNATADYVILDSSRDKDFASLFNSTAAAGKVAVRAAFVHDCVEAGILLHTRDYIFSELSVNKRKRPIASPGVSTSPKRKSQASKTKTADQKTSMTQKTSSPTKQAKMLANPDPTRKSSTPPPVTTPNAKGHYQFTDSEHQYILHYAKLLLERDIHTSNNSIASHAFKKMPWHSVASWRSYVSTRLHHQLDVLREEVKLQRARIQSGKHETADLQGSPSKKARLETTPDTSQDNGAQAPDTHSSNPDQEDFQTICEFFAFGHQSSGDDHEIWDSLANHRPCRSHTTWPEFYVKYMDKIDRKIQVLVQHQVPTAGEMESVPAELGTDTLPQQTNSEFGQHTVVDVEAGK